MSKVFLVLLAGFLISCKSQDEQPSDVKSSTDGAHLVVLGTVQDGGSPHAGCTKDCCRKLYDNPVIDRLVSCIGLIDSKSNKSFIIDATPDLVRQIELLRGATKERVVSLDGVVLTHGHIGHYTGLMYFGRESMNTEGMKVYAMPRMKKFLEENGPWSQLVALKNIDLVGITENMEIALSNELQIVPILVPHRDEYTETVGFVIKGPKRKALFIPDIDKWDKWSKSIIEIVREVDYAFLDATFYDNEEVKRDMSEIPHPFVVESMELMSELSTEDRSKVHFIHMNHTNPILDTTSTAYRNVILEGFRVAKVGSQYEL